MNKRFDIQRPYYHVPNMHEETHAISKNVQRAKGYTSSENSDAEVESLPQDFLRDDFEGLPELSEFEVVRHFTLLSQLNFSIDGGFYPLGSCTMKYNPKINDKVAGMDGFVGLHPYTPSQFSQGALEVMFSLQEALVEITGLKACSLHPAAGAQGEFVGVKMIAAYHRNKGDSKRKYIIVPDSAHGTNPASAALCGFLVKQVKSGPNGTIELADIEKLLDDSIAAVMLTVPNTLGIFENNISEISRLAHERGALMYCDGANLNALVGQVDFKAMGIDVMHINLHKTFSTPHGGGGPGAGPVVVSENLVDYLPIPVIRKNGEDRYDLDYSVPHSVGKFRAFYGNFGMLVRALCYIYAYGSDQLKSISDTAVLNANYIRARLKGSYHLPYEQPSLHEVVFTDKWQEKESHVSTLHIAKRIIDYGFHPPTVYFPLVVSGALMIEPTETESKATLDRFVDSMIEIAKEAKDNPDIVKTAPHRAGFKKMDETRAARHPILTWNDSESD
ncbi:MAG: aminomethyl-transferring glycine dehydrogenase subunit GcvPB [Bdellovibrionales bacterium]|nr:aminomethyl-transferring glycine dehydrogenase subunit GcvPB [Bdellovibrionales bacterium]